ncbi:hypothetical protein FIBSPDRAFT_677479, partial [Athelia psychrophila]
VVPVECIIVDEASQIEIGQYLPMLSRFETSLKKLVFIGDDKQLAPYGQDDIGNLRSIFEVDHLRRKVIFLNTQYRMPVPIGAFISRHVYEGKLRTQHNITASSSCRFKDVPNGEELLVGCSWVNPAELEVVLQIATQLREQGKSYRFITPYDAMRTAVELAMGESGLDWADKCFNVDSFQGNEDDYIIISIVRSSALGFLKS